MRTNVFKHGVSVLILTGLVFLVPGCASGGPALVPNSRRSGNFFFAPIGDGSTAAITGYTGRAKKVIIPAEIEGKPVRKIGAQVFQVKDTITEVVIPNGVTSIGFSAFSSCGSLTSITIPNGVTEIGGSAFSYCTSLTSVAIPDSVTEIGSWAFSNCFSLTSITIPASVKTIGASAFSSCSRLTTVTFEEGAAVVFDGDVFAGCRRLDANSRLAVEKARVGATPVLVQAQQGTSGAQTPEPVVTEDDFEIRQNAQGGITITRYTGKAKNVAIPTTISGLPVTEIGGDAFTYGYMGLDLTGITIPDGVTSIGAYAFSPNTFHRENQNRLQNLVIPDSVTRIGNGAFYDCSIRTLALGKGLKNIGFAAFADNAIENLTIPDSVTTIGDFDASSIGNEIGTFQNCGIKTLNLGNGLVTIGINAFADNGISELLLPPVLKRISWGAFRNNQLTELAVPEGVTYIRNHSLYSNPFDGNPLASLTIPPSLARYDNGEYRERQGFDGSFRGLPITRITLPANVNETNLRQFGESFVNFWNVQGKKAGTYVYTGRIWTVQ
jgi:hypothetical protein